MADPNAPSHATTDSDDDDEFDRWWRKQQPWLKERGYLLRARYTPGWVPSWKGKKGVLPSSFEDGVTPNFFNVLDATRKDGKRFCLKRISKTECPDEAAITRQFSTPPLSSDPANHCVPLVEVLSVPDDPTTVILVIPLLRRWDSPRMETVGEAVEFIRQLFQGVAFMHKHGVGHRDIKHGNVMMDATEMYPDGFHFVEHDRNINFQGQARHFSRTQKPPKYYLIDFGYSKQYDLSKGPPVDVPKTGGDKTVPEYFEDRYDKPCDPFKVDVYCTGNIIRRYFTEGHVSGGTTRYHAKKGFEFLKPLIADMVQDGPSKRPSMDEVVQRFDKLCRSLGTWKLRSRLAEKREWAVVSLARDIPHYARTARYIVGRLPALPVPKV